jgi:hypothetical protein
MKHSLYLQYSAPKTWFPRFASEDTIIQALLASRAVNVPVWPTAMHEQGLAMSLQGGDLEEGVALRRCYRYAT